MSLFDIWRAHYMRLNQNQHKHYAIVNKIVEYYIFCTKRYESSKNNQFFYIKQKQLYEIKQSKIIKFR